MRAGLTGDRTAIVGAGLAGLTVAERLQSAGRVATVFEKSRGRGGRMSTRRAGDLRFDHGAQFFTARDPAFRAEVERWTQQGRAAPWDARLVRLPGEDPVAEELFVGTPGMSAPGGLLAEGLDVRLATRVVALTRSDSGWRIRSEDGRVHEPFSAVVIAAPAEQTAALLREVTPLADDVARVRSLPCWAVMAEFSAPLHTGYDAARIEHGALSWIAHDGSKPGRDPTTATWVLHASPEWSAQHLETPVEDVGALLVAELETLVGSELPAAVSVRAHLWRYARTDTALGVPFVWDSVRRIGACGDWCLGARVEAAFQSGTALAERILAD